MTQKISEYHTGYHAYDREVLENIDYNRNANNLVFEKQFLPRFFYKDVETAEITSATKYFEEASFRFWSYENFYFISIL